jgi:hypothetical protein
MLFCCCQVEALEAATRGGGGFNQPQYLHLQEALAAVVTSLDALQVSHVATFVCAAVVDACLRMHANVLCSSSC